MSKAKIFLLGLLASGCALVWVPAAVPATPAVVCTLAPGQTSLAPGTRHGLAAHLQQYPDLSLATAAQKTGGPEAARARPRSVGALAERHGSEGERLQHASREARAR